MVHEVGWAAPGEVGCSRRGHEALWRSPNRRSGTTTASAPRPTVSVVLVLVFSRLRVGLEHHASVGSDGPLSAASRATCVRVHRLVTDTVATRHFVLERRATVAVDHSHREEPILFGQLPEGLFTSLPPLLPDQSSSRPGG